MLLFPLSSLTVFADVRDVHHLGRVDHEAVSIIEAVRTPLPTVIGKRSHKLAALAVLFGAD
jgi:hypothetical protein